MKTTILVFLLCAVGLRADLLVTNLRSEAALVEGVTVNAGATQTVTSTNTVPTVAYGPSLEFAATFEAVDGTTVLIGENGVTSATPLSSWVEIFMKGFFVGAVWETMGLLFRVVSALKSNRAEVL